MARCCPLCAVLATSFTATEVRNSLEPTILTVMPRDTRAEAPRPKKAELPEATSKRSCSEVNAEGGNDGINQQAASARQKEIDPVRERVGE